MNLSSNLLNYKQNAVAAAAAAPYPGQYAGFEAYPYTSAAGNLYSNLTIRDSVVFLQKVIIIIFFCCIFNQLQELRLLVIWPLTRTRHSRKAESVPVVFRACHRTNKQQALLYKRQDYTKLLNYQTHNFI